MRCERLSMIGGIVACVGALTLLWALMFGLLFAGMLLSDWQEVSENLGLLLALSGLFTVCFLTYQHRDWQAGYDRDVSEAIITPRMIRKLVFVLSVVGLCFYLVTPLLLER